MRTKPVRPAAPTADLSAGLRQYLYFTAAITGMVIMIVEILGAKMLAPYVGTSHFVWTAQIAVTLMALATGYYAGGRLVDRTPQLGRLYGAILAAAIYLCLTVLIVKPVAFWCLNFRLALGSLLASTVLFFVPLALLAMVGPFFVRMLTLSVNKVGGNVGRLTSIGTLGSFLGTILIGYVLIPFLPNSLTMFLSAGLLMLVSAGYFFRWNGKQTPVAAVLLAMIAGLTTGSVGVAEDNQPPKPEMATLFRGNSNFGQLLVLDVPQVSGGVHRVYLNDFLVQDSYDPATKQSAAAFTYLLHGLARAYAPKIDDALCIGLGVGIVPGELLRDGARVDVVEINPAVVPVAKKLFDCPIDKLNLTIGDGRQFVNSCTKKYDAVILDAFLGDSSPSHLMTREAFSAIHGVLNSNGVLVINTFGHFERGHDFLTGSLDKTLKSVFRNVRIHATSRGNVAFVASDQPDLKLARPASFADVHPDCRDDVETAFADTAETDPHSGIVLTDDYNPSEFYDARNREELRRLLARSMQ
ncbi:MAG: spermidine synthase [Pedosphaera sp.]|nr:spermidine synthase [Pedosphaera sp.]